MLRNITFYTSDKIWEKILAELGAAFAPKEIADIIVMPDKKMNSIKLRAFFINQIESSNRAIIKKVFGRDENLSWPQIKIISLLYRSGGVLMDDLKRALGYSAQSDTHAIDTMIYVLRKIYGKDFIKYENGKYRL